VIFARRRRGTIVSHRPPLPARPPAPLPRHVRDLAHGNPDPRLLPRLPRIQAPVGAGPRLYAEQASLPQLLEIAAQQFAADGIAAESLTVVGGALDGIERVLGAHLRPGDRIGVEDPGFSRVLDLVRAMALVPVPFAVDDRGPTPEALEIALRGRLDACVVTPRAQNPTGAAIDKGRAQELRRVLRPHPDVLIIEDDHAGPVAGAPAVSLCDRGRPRRAVIRSVSKALGPDLRLAVIAGDSTTIARVEGRQLLGTGWVSHILQRMVVTLWSDPRTERRLRTASETYRTRRDALIQALAHRGIRAHGVSGLNVWVPVGEETRLLQALLEKGWGVASGERFRVQSPPAIRITISSLEPAEAARLAEDLARSLAPQHRTHAS
jgi:DNA-binding transcriptional MocR family regulator